MVGGTILCVSNKTVSLLCVLVGNSGCVKSLQSNTVFKHKLYI